MGFHCRTGFATPSVMFNIARTLYFYQRGAKVVITHGFIKKSQKTPKREIEKAKILRKEYDRRSGHDKL